MIRRYLRRTLTGFLITAMTPGVALAGVPTEGIKETTDKIIRIVSDPALKSEEKERERKQLIRQAIDERFNWEEMARRTLARHWRNRTEEEKQEFIDLYGKLLERTYLEKVEGYSGEKVIYEGEQIDGDYGVVQVKIITQQQTEIPTEYRVKRKGEDWLVYDISIEGVSLVNNYRSQFNSIITRSSYQDLIKKLKQKIETE
jgi:phospholipid transport system substrate-binding protein